VTLTRRQYLVAAGVAGVGIAGCGSTATEPATGPELAGQYAGPPVTSSFWNGFTGGDGPAMRRLVAASVPVLLLYLAAQRYVVEGVSRAGLKG
jgi:hypothetical protein